MAAAYAPLAALDFRTAYVVHTLLSLGAIAASVLLARRFSDTADRYPWLIGAAAVLSYPLLRAYLGGQNTAFGLLVIVGAWLLLGLIAGVWLLAHQKTIGLLILAGCCIAFIPLGLLFMRSEAHSPEEAWLLVAIFLPGVLMGWASLIAFARPMLSFLRTDA